MNPLRILLHLICLFSILILSNCGKRKKSESDQVDTYAKLSTLKIPNFNADSAYSFVAKQVNFGPRVPNTPSHRNCGDYIIRSMENSGWKVTVQPFTSVAYDGTKMDLRNIIASLNPDAKKRIVIAAHWDTRHVADADTSRKKEPIPGANDGGSGVGVLMELARAINQDSSKPTIGIDLVFFDGEDHGQPDDSGFPEKENTWCLGSQYWSKNFHTPGYSAYYGILLDMVGGKNAKFAMDGTSMNYAPDIVRKVWDIGNRVGYSSYFVYTKSDAFIDDHYYVNQMARIPMIDIIEYDNSDGVYFNNHWHTHADNLENIDRNSLKAVGQTLLNVVYFEE